MTLQEWQQQAKIISERYNVNLDDYINKRNEETFTLHTPEEFVLAHIITDKYNGIRTSPSNYEYLQQTDKCGCYYCLNIFNPNQIEYDGNNLCPYCATDSIMPDNPEYPVDKKLLEMLNRVMFSGMSEYK